MHAVKKKLATGWDAGPPDASLQLIDAAVGDLAAGILVVRGTGADARIAYANDAMQALAGGLLSERSEMRLADLPSFGAGLLALLEEAEATQSSIDRRVAVHGRSCKHPVRAQVRATPAGSAYRLIRVESDHDDVEAASEDPHRLARCAQAAGAGHWHWDLVTGSAWYDTAACRLIAPGTRDHSARHLHARVHDNDREVFLNAIRRHLEQTLPLDVEFRLRDCVEETWVRLRGAAHRDDAGLPIQLSGTIEDVSVQRRATAELVGAQEFLRGMFDTLRTCIAVLNDAGEIIEINRSWTEFPSAAGLTGLRYGYGEKYADLCRSAQDRCAAGRAAADGVERVLAGLSEDFVLDYRAVCLEGVERAMNMRVRPFTTARGRCVMVTHTDSTIVDRATRAMRENDAFYRMILNAIPLYVSYVNGERELVHANRLAEEWLGQPIDVLRGRRLQDLMDADAYAAIEPRVDKVLRGRRIDFESHLQREPAGLDIAVSYVPHVVNGAVEGFFSVARDVTQEKRLESELLQSQKMEAMGRLTGGIAHDFNNLLSVIIGNLQLLERELADAPSWKAQVRTALGAASRGADLTRRLLSFARPKARDATPIDANALIDGLQELITRSLGSSVQLTLELASGLWPIRVDAGELENALLNLAINARDAMGADGHLRVVTRNVHIDAAAAPQAPSLTGGDYVEVSVCDTGCGMPDEVVRKAFEPFFTTKEPGKGTGLGLSIVYGFTMRSGGTALIDSTPGIGTSVRLFFPRFGGRPGRPPDAAPRSASRVLVVDDDVERCQATARLLRDEGLLVDTAADTSQALGAVAAADPPDLVLLGPSVCAPAGAAEWTRRLESSNHRVRVLCPSADDVVAQVSSDPSAADTSPLLEVVRSALAEELADHV